MMWSGDRSFRPCVVASNKEGDVVWAATGDSSGEFILSYRSPSTEWRWHTKVVPRPSAEFSAICRALNQ